MYMSKYQTWDELSQPARWDHPLRAAMAELEQRLPALLGPGRLWLHRNVSWSDMVRIENSKEHPPARIGDSKARPSARNGWPLPYLVCDYRKALFGFRLEHCAGKRRERVPESIPFSIDLPCYRFLVDTGDPAGMEWVAQMVAKEARQARRQKNAAWKCPSEPVRAGQDTEALAKRGLLMEDHGEWVPTIRGEDAGLMTLLTAGPDGKTIRQTRWTPETRAALLVPPNPVPIPLQKRIRKLERGLSCDDQYAADAVRELAELSLERYFLPCPEVNKGDLLKLRISLGLNSGCSFQTAAAALYRRIRKTKNREEARQLMLLARLFALPVGRMDEKEKNTVVKEFREGRFFT